MGRFLADENFPFPVIEALRRRGQDVVSLNDLGKAGREPLGHLKRDIGRAGRFSQSGSS